MCAIKYTYTDKVVGRKSSAVKPLCDEWLNSREGDCKKKVRSCKNKSPLLALRPACFAAGVGGPSVEKDVRRRAAGRPGTSRQTEGRRVGPGAWFRGEAHPAWTWTAGSVHCRMPSARSCCTPSRGRTRRFCRSSRSGCSEPRSYSRGRSQWRAYLSRVRWWICRRRSRGGGSGDSWSRCLPERGAPESGAPPAAAAEAAMLMWAVFSLVGEAMLLVCCAEFLATRRSTALPAAIL
eukprot:scaffold13721_cov144-Isochrysis_galbana.AAC.1